MDTLAGFHIYISFGQYKNISIKRYYVNGLINLRLMLGVVAISIGCVDVDYVLACAFQDNRRLQELREEGVDIEGKEDTE